VTVQLCPYCGTEVEDDSQVFPWCSTACEQDHADQDWKDQKRDERNDSGV